MAAKPRNQGHCATLSVDGTRLAAARPVVECDPRMRRTAPKPSTSFANGLVFRCSAALTHTDGVPGLQPPNWLVRSPNLEEKHNEDRYRQDADRRRRRPDAGNRLGLRQRALAKVDAANAMLPTRLRLTPLPPRPLPTRLPLRPRAPAPPPALRRARPTRRCRPPRPRRLAATRRTRRSIARSRSRWASNCLIDRSSETKTPRTSAAFSLC